MLRLFFHPKNVHVPELNARSPGQPVNFGDQVLFALFSFCPAPFHAFRNAPLGCRA